MFLTREQLKSMTNGKRPKEIIRWLRENAPGKFRIGVDGWPVVHQTVVEQMFGVYPRLRSRPVPHLNLEPFRAREEADRRKTTGNIPRQTEAKNGEK
jgi:hypothetical protein